MLKEVLKNYRIVFELYFLFADVRFPFLFFHFEILLEARQLLYFFVHLKENRCKSVPA
jgi:hypothetical protein